MAPPRPPPNTALMRWCSHHLLRRKLPRSVAASVPIALAITTSFVILVYNTSFFFRNRSSSVINTPGVVPSFVPPFLLLKHEVDFPNSARNDGGDNEFELGSSDFELFPDNEEVDHSHAHNLSMGGGTNNTDHQHVFAMSNNVSTSSPSPTSSDGDLSNGTTSQNAEVFHDKEIFLPNYKEMNTSLKIYIYPHNKKDPFAHSLLPPVDDQNPGGNYASETYFKNVLFKSHFITHDPSEADLFFLPFSIARLRHDRRVGVAGLSDFIKGYMANISTAYPYWNRTGGADHFYVACHSVGRLAMEKVEYVKANAIQVVCSSSYFLPNYYSHKDVGLPQIWPRHEELPHLASSKRKKLAFFAGSMNSPARKAVLQSWQNDTTIFAHSGRLKTPYSEQLLGSKYCLHVKGFEVNTARIGDALYYGCVPVILADYYDLPFMDILNWRSFSVVVATSDIPNLKRILNRISPQEYSVLHGNVLKVRKHFQWNRSPLDFDVFYMVMYELWLRRSSIRVLF